MAVLNQRIERWRAAYEEFALEKAAALSHRLKESASGSGLCQHLEGQLRLGGKRIRPVLLMAADWAMGGTDTPTRQTLAAAFALECFHTFLLVHDDVVDQSTRRRNRPTLHIELEEEKSLSRLNATNLAIILGDILYSTAIEALIDLPPEHLHPVLRYFTRITEKTGMGEALEILTMERSADAVTRHSIETIYELKTSLYTFEAPFRIAAILQEAPTTTHTSFYQFACVVGLAFQILNDLHEVNLPRAEFGQLAYDFRAGVKTLYLYELLQEASTPDRNRLFQIMKEKAWTEPDIDFLYHLVQTTTAKDRLRARAVELLDQGDRYLQEAPLPSATLQRLQEISRFIRSNTRHSEEASE